MASFHKELDDGSFRHLYTICVNEHDNSQKYSPASSRPSTCPDRDSGHGVPPRNVGAQHQRIPDPSQADHARLVAVDTRATVPSLHQISDIGDSKYATVCHSHCMSISLSNVPSSLSSSHCAFSRALRFCRAGSAFSSAPLAWSNISPKKEQAGSEVGTRCRSRPRQGTSSNANQKA